jgi:hypothetical protein
MSSRKLSLVLAGCTAAVLLVMVVISVATGATQELHEHYKPPAEYARDLLVKPDALRLVFALDVAFLVLYTGFFAAFAKYLRELGQPFTYLALGAMIGTAVLDVLEDHHILALLALAEHGRPIDDGSIVFQDVLSSTKFTISYLSLFMFGVAIPRTSMLGWVLALFLTAGTLFTAVLGYGAPPSWRESLDSTRWIGFVAGFGIAVAWLRSAPEPASASTS